MFDNIDIEHMRYALTLAWKGRFSTSPNPRVGCVLAQGNKIVGEGFHIQAGLPHAEVYALQQAGEAAKGATAYVTLEPCAHYGRTAPCAEALVHAGVVRVVAAMVDPNPLVAGRGLSILRNAGITVEYGLLETEARLLNRGFLSRIEQKRPFVKLKTAMSLDGKTALSDGRSQWITESAARADVQILRAESCAVLTGIGTVLEDNPRLNVRAFPTVRQPIRVVVDSNLRLSEYCHLVQDGQATWVVTTVENDGRFDAYPNIRVKVLPQQQGRVDLEALLLWLAEEGIGELMIEAGATLNTAFLQAGLVDEMVIYQSPKMLGESARGVFTLSEDASVLAKPSNWKTVDVMRLENDIKWTLQKCG